MSVKVRFAPSPTGYLHIGGLRTALFNYLYAKKAGGTLVLRIEDTDQSRQVEGSVENLINTFQNIGITFNEGPGQGGVSGPYFQSERLEIYRKFFSKLIDFGNAYYCFCSSERLINLREKLTQEKQTIKYDRYCLQLSPEDISKRMKTESYIVRMKIPDEEEITFYDGIRDKVTIRCDEIDDQVLIKGDGFPTYHFANIIDDHLMGITHVLRGEEWLSSTPKHVLLYRFFDWKTPKYFHLPLLLNQDKSKLSKRQGDVAVEDFLKNGFLPEAILNYVALLGWHSSTDREFFTLKELEKEFSLKRLQKSGAVFDIEKLKWMNAHYLKSLPESDIAFLVKPFFENNAIDISDKVKFNKVVDFARQRCSTLAEMPVESQMFFNSPVFSEIDLELLKPAEKLLANISEKLEELMECPPDKFKQIVLTVGENLGFKGKELFFPVRTALYGSSKGPDIPQIYDILGRKEVLSRFKKAQYEISGQE